MTIEEIRAILEDRRELWGDKFDAYKAGFLNACLQAGIISSAVYAHWDEDEAREDAKEAALAYFTKLTGGRSLGNRFKSE